MSIPIVTAAASGARRGVQNSKGFLHDEDPSRGGAKTALVSFLKVLLVSQDSRSEGRDNQHSRVILNDDSYRRISRRGCIFLPLRWPNIYTGETITI